MIPAKGKYYLPLNVTEGHPDKVADRISDAVLDSLLTQDPESCAWPAKLWLPRAWPL